MTSSTDVPGVLAKDINDAATVLEVIAGHDQHDATSLVSKKVKYTLTAKFDWKNIRVGVPDFKVTGPVKKEFDRMVSNLKKSGAKIVKISLPSTEYAIAAYYIITPSEVSSNLARFDGLRFGTHKGKKKISESYEAVREAGFGPEVKRRIMLGTYCLSAGYYDAYYIRAQKVRTKIINEFAKAFSRCDVIMTPTTPTPAFKIGAKKKNPLEMYMEDVFLAPASLAGLPAISVPVAKDPLPIGIQLIAPSQSEARLLAISRSVESLGIDRFMQPNV
jgi:aspartyl-tRNA(Asn)/glutamyl-tRNA(Gln) amidotransferase subunit A